MYITKTQGAGNPITDIKVIFPKRKEGVPFGCILLERTPFKYEADVNAGASSSTTIFLCYRQRLRNVELLSEDAVIMSGGSDGGHHNSNSSSLGGGGGGGYVSRNTSYDALLSGTCHELNPIPLLKAHF